MAKNGVATKEDIKRLEKRLEKKMSGTNSSVETLKSSVESLESRVLESEVKILGELKDMREDFATHQFSHMRINDELQEHDGRLRKLETIKI